MKKTAVMLLATLLLCLAPPGFGESAGDLMPQELYKGRIGRVGFALPNLPQRLPDQDYPGLWANSVQLFGSAPDGAEFQLRTADIGEWIEGYKQAYPDAGMKDWQAQALFGYAMFMINTFKGEFSGMSAGLKDGLVYAEFDYTYPDTPGQAYHAKAILDGNTAVSLTAAVSARTDAMFASLRGLSQEEVEKLPPPEPVVWQAGSLSAVFPEAIHEAKASESMLYACFTADFSLLQIQAFPMGFSLPEAGKALKDELVVLARRVMLPAIGGETVYKPEMSCPAPDTVLLAFESVITDPFGEEFGQRFLGRLYLGARGVFYVWAADTETGRAFMDSLKVSALE